MIPIGSFYRDMAPLGLMGTTGSEVPLVAIGSDTTTVGAIIDGHGSDRVLLALMDKTLTDGDYEFQLFHGDASDLADEAEVSASDILGSLPDWDADTDDDQLVTMELILRKRYFRIKIVSTNFSASGVDAIGGVALLHKLKMPAQT